MPDQPSLFASRPLSRPPENFNAMCACLEIDPKILYPCRDRPGLWWYPHDGGVRHFEYVDTIDPRARGFEPGGRYRTWREAVKRLKRRRR